MAAHMSAEEYSKTYSTFGGCDIVAAFNGHVIGSIQAITYSLTRERSRLCRSHCIYRYFFSS